MEDVEIIDITPDTIAQYGVCGYKDIKKHEELRRKITWFERYYPLGLRIKALMSKTGGYQGMIEYIPGKYAHRPVDADSYLFIHCIFTGFKKEYKGKGYGSMLIRECIREAERASLAGVGVVTRKGAFMADHDIFFKLDFICADRTPPDFELLVYRFDPMSPLPRFKPDIAHQASKYPNGLTLFRSAQCPYTEKNVREIIKTAEENFQIRTHLVEMEDVEAIQSSPCGFGTFCIVYNGTVICHHPISNTRFINIMKKIKDS